MPQFSWNPNRRHPTLSPAFIQAPPHARQQFSFWPQVAPRTGSSRPRYPPLPSASKLSNSTLSPCGSPPWGAWKPRREPLPGTEIRVGQLRHEFWFRAALQRALDRLAEFKLPIRITEFNFPGQQSKYYQKRGVRLSDEEEQAKARALADYFRICFAHPSVEGILLWGFIAIYIDLVGSMARTGLMFVVSGVFLIVFGLVLEKKRRSFLLRMKPSSTSSIGRRRHPAHGRVPPGVVWTEFSNRPGGRLHDPR